MSAVPRNAESIVRRTCVDLMCGFMRQFDSLFKTVLRPTVIYRPAGIGSVSSVDPWWCSKASETGSIPSPQQTTIATDQQSLTVFQ